MENIKKMLLAAGAVVMLASCSEDQTEYNIENVPGRAKISGTIVYNEGTTIENGRFSYNYKPLASHEVILEVPNSYYKPYADGVKVYTTSTDASGKYSFDIPATDQSGSATISIRPFEGTTTTVKNVDQKPQVVKEQVIYRGSASVSVKNRGLEIENFQCAAYAVDAVPESFSKSVSFKTVIGQNFEYKTPITPRYNNNNVISGYADAKIDKVWQPASNVDFIVEIDCAGAAITLNGTTDAKGECSLQVPVEKLPASFFYRVTPVSYLGKFTHYVRGEKPVERQLPSGTKVEVYDYEAVTLDGWYQSTGDITGSVSYEFANFVQKAECKSMLFHVLPGAEDKGYTTSGWGQATPWLADFLKDQESK